MRRDGSGLHGSPDPALGMFPTLQLSPENTEGSEQLGKECIQSFTRRLKFDPDSSLEIP